jgi:TonB-linked SusC/RagA family outer membrane protein
MKKCWFKQNIQMHGYFKKILLVMKFTAILMLAFALQVSASNSYSQNKKLDLSMENASLKQVFSKIEQQSQFSFFYKDDMINLNKRYSMNMNDVVIKDVLNNVLSDQGLTYQINNKVIVILEEHMVQEQQQQQEQVTGTVTDAESGDPLPGVTVQVVGTTKGTITQTDGTFQIEVSSLDVTLRFSFVGYQAKEIPLEGRTSLDVTLSQKVQELDEVVVIGYGERQREDVTTSVSSVQSEDIEQLSSINPEEALQGSVPGVRIQSGGGTPWARNEIRIRGVNTWGVASPLIVIDGVPITEFGAGAEGQSARVQDLRGPVSIMSMINPSDIESISVLKDASAAAIYGMRASNGVVLIETKQGEAGRTQVDFSARYGVKNIPQTYDVLNMDQYVNLYTEAFANNPDMDLPSVFDPESQDYLGNRSFHDWQSPLINKNAISQNYNLKVSGGDKKSTYYASLGYTNEESPLIRDELERYTFTANTQVDATEFMTAGFNLKGTWETNDAGRNGSLSYMAQTPPWQPIHGEGAAGYAPSIVDNTRGGGLDGTKKWGPETDANVFGTMALNHKTYRLFRILGKAFLELKPFEGMSIKGRVSTDYYYNRENTFEDIDDFMFGTTPGDPINQANPERDDTEGSYGEGHFRNKNLVKEVIVNYNKSFGEHNLDLLFNAQDQWYGFEGINGSTEELRYANPLYWSTGSTKREYNRTFSDEWENSLQGYMGRASYNWNNRYYADFTLRYDGSSKFAKGNRWDWFPSFSLAWRISDESFMSGMDWLTDLKLRGGWGKLGNQEIANYAYVSLANESTAYSFGLDPTARHPGMGYLQWGAAFNTPPNKALQWETTYNTNVGFDAIIMQNFSATVEAYYKKTSNLLSSIEIPASTGFVSDPPDNFGAVVNQGLDVQLGYRGRTGNWNYAVNGNIGFVKNEVVKLKDDAPFGSGTGRVAEGKPLNYIYGYEVGGMFQTEEEVEEYQENYDDVPANAGQVSPGDMWFKDIRGNPGEEDRFYSPNPDSVVNNYDRHYLGKTIPGFTYGFNFSVGYKNVSLSANFYGEGDVSAYNYTRVGLVNMSSKGNNQITDVMDRWTEEDPDTDMPRAVAGDPAKNNRFSSRFVEDASYFRMQSLRLSYTLPDWIYSSMGTGQKITIWAGGSNLFTLTNWSGLDPSTGGVPTPRVFRLGLNATF